MQTTPSQPVTTHSTHGAAHWIWRLHIVCSADRQRIGQVLRLGEDAYTWQLGRAHDGAIEGLRFHDPMMSREHLRLTVQGRGALTVAVEDLASTNGTFANGTRVIRADAGTGAVLRFGDTVAVLEADRDRARVGDSETANVPGHSEAARITRAVLRAAAERGLPVLIVGETGTGKEFAASEVHRLSHRKGPMVRINTVAPPDSLFEAELFGSAAGAYTGANKARRGRIAEAHGGTFVLDEIGELPMAQQAKLLRVLEEGAVRPLGASADQCFDVRFVASTNADLEQRVAEGRFRADLLARLRGSTVTLAPLHERRPDLFDLADAVAPLLDDRAGRPQRWRARLPPEVVEALLLRPWPYNLRELRSVLRELQPIAMDREALLRWLQTNTSPPLADGHQPRTAAPPFPGSPAPGQLHSPPPWWGPVTPRAGSFASPQPSSPEWPPRRRRAPKPEAMRELLERCEGNIEAMARELGCARRQVYRWLEAAGIDEAAIAAAREVDR